MSDRAVQPDCLVRYVRNGDLIELTMHYTDAELRQLLVGLWMRLDPEARADHIHELEHYLQPGSRLSSVARVIAEGEKL